MDARHVDLPIAELLRCAESIEHTLAALAADRDFQRKVAGQAYIGLGESNCPRVRIDAVTHQVWPEGFKPVLGALAFLQFCLRRRCLRETCAGKYAKPKRRNDQPDRKHLEPSQS